MKVLPFITAIDQLELRILNTINNDNNLVLVPPNNSDDITELFWAKLIYDKNKHDLMLFTLEDHESDNVVLSRYML